MKQLLGSEMTRKLYCDLDLNIYLMQFSVQSAWDGGEKMSINNTKIQLQLTDPLVRTRRLFPAPSRFSFLQLACTFVEILMEHYHIPSLSVNFVTHRFHLSIILWTVVNLYECRHIKGYANCLYHLNFQFYLITVTTLLMFCMSVKRGHWH